MISQAADHLWQSTLFAVAAALMTAAFRKNTAAVRYWLWFAASAKFLIPFSMLIGFGSALRWAPAAREIAAQITTDSVPLTIVRASQPFHDARVLALPMADSGHWQPIAVLCIWAIGFAAVVLMRFRGWRSIRRALRHSAPSDMASDVEVRSCPGLLEPGVVGVFRPRLLLPAGIGERLTAAQMNAVLAHELCHVRRRDNLLAAIHMAVEAVFWFHPLVWAIGTRLVEERERACDEEVLTRGAAPKVYAEGIVSICRLYTESPLACMSGVTGSNLKKRIEIIMDNRPSAKLDFPRKTILTLAGFAALAAPVGVGMMTARAGRAQSVAASALRFDVASVKPTAQQGSDVQGLGDIRVQPGGRLVAEKAQLRYFIQNAYGLKPFQLSGGPAWISSAHYDIEGKAKGEANSSQMRLMMQALLEERFKLKVHHETKELPLYELEVAKGGAKLPEPKEGSCTPPDPNAPGLPTPGGSLPCGRIVMVMSPSGAQLRGGKVTMAEVIRVLSNALNQTVLDKTGITRTFDVHLEFTPDDSLGGVPWPPPGAPPSGGAISPAATPDVHGNIFSAIEEQLGLKLKSAKGPVDVLIIDSVERPSAN